MRALSGLNFGTGAPPNIVTNGLVLWLDAANRISYPESGVTWGDLSSQGNKGTLQNGVGYTASNGGAIDFDGTDDYVTFSSNPSATNAITVEVWCKIDSSNLTKTLVAFWVAGRDSAYRMIGNSASFSWVCATSNNSWYSAGTALSGSSNLNDGSNWHHVVGTYDGSNNKIYVNNVLKQTGSAISGTVSTSGAHPFELGRPSISSANVANTKGLVPVVRVYNRALSADEISKNFTALRGRYGI